MEGPFDFDKQTVVRLESITPDAELHLMRDARISSKDRNSDRTGLITYLIKHGHWSPFEMVHIKMYVECSRAIARQILRHRSFSFQEFSQRYQTVDVIRKDRVRWEARLESDKNRQSSLGIQDPEARQLIQTEFDNVQERVWQCAIKAYNECINAGIAREQARALLPEGLTFTRMCMAGTLRSWIHYIDLRTKQDTQYEHRVVAEKAKALIALQCPVVAKALGWTVA